jgi:hypothetical protein
VQAELERLRATPAPSIVGGVVLISIGFPFLLGGLGFGVGTAVLALAMSANSMAAAPLFLVIAIILGLPGLICLAAGIGAMSSALAAQDARERRISTLEAELRARREVPPPLLLLAAF